MNQRGKERITKLLVLVMLVTFLCGSTAMAQERQTIDWPYAGSMKAGDHIQGITVQDANNPSDVHYGDYRFFVNGTEYFCKEEFNWCVPLYDWYEVRTVEIIPEEKTVKVNADKLIEIKTLSHKGQMKKVGDTVAIDLAGECKAEMEANKDKKFLGWYVWGWRPDGTNGKGIVEKYTMEAAAALLGIEEEIWKNPETGVINFTVPAEWEEKGFKQAGINPMFEGSTVSGNVPSEPEGDGSGKPSGNKSSNSSETTAPEPVAKNEVVLSGGTTLKSIGAMHNVANGINGAAVMTSQEKMNTSAGLSPQDVEAGTNAKLYIGNTYKKSERAILTDAVSKTGAKVVNMINIDLYTIAKNGKVNNVTILAGENPEPVRVVIGLPEGAAKEGRSFSLVYMDENGQTVEAADTDNDLRTMTVDLTHFGSFVIVYR